MKRHFLRKFFCTVWVCFLFCLGCASVKKSVQLGVVTGALTGAGSMALMSHESEEGQGGFDRGFVRGFGGRSGWLFYPRGA